MTNISHAEASPDRRRRAAVVVAHPDDETLWCGGYILTHPEYSLAHREPVQRGRSGPCAKIPPGSRRLGAEGEMADLDDGPDQTPLPAGADSGDHAQLMAGTGYNLILSHGPNGEYTRHRRHRECCQAVVELWRSGVIHTSRLWLFAYEDGGGAYLPRVRDDADRREFLTDEVWLEKRRLITDLYGFEPGSWEARCTPREEGFWCFDSVRAAMERAGTGSNDRESAGVDRIPSVGGRPGDTGPAILQGIARDRRGCVSGAFRIAAGEGMVLPLVPAGRSGWA